MNLRRGRDKVLARRSSSRPWLCNHNRSVHVQMGQFQSVNRDDLRLTTDIDLESLGTTFNDPEGAFVGALQRSTVCVMTDEYELGPLKLSWHGYRCSFVSRGRDGG